KDSQVINMVASNGNTHHLDHLVNDEKDYVRQTVAGRGNDSHHAKLLDDPNSDVRRIVASKSNNLEHLKYLEKDSTPDVRRTAERNQVLKDYYWEKNKPGPLQNWTKKHLDKLKK